VCSSLDPDLDDRWAASMAATAKIPTAPGGRRTTDRKRLPRREDRGRAGSARGGDATPKPTASCVNRSRKTVIPGAGDKRYFAAIVAACASRLAARIEIESR
jgi:hypothetical protein